MEKNIVQKLWNLPSELEHREKVEEIEKEFLKGSFFENPEDIEIELKDGEKQVLYPDSSKYNHYFSDGLYIREMFLKAGYFAFTLIHKTQNPLFVLKGIMWCTSENGIQKLVAPTFVLTEPGTKRMCWFPEETVIVNVHPNPNGITDLKEMEKEIYACTPEQYDEDLKRDVWIMFEHKEYHKKIKNENKN